MLELALRGGALGGICLIVEVFEEVELPRALETALDYCATVLRVRPLLAHKRDDPRSLAPVNPPGRESVGEGLLGVDLVLDDASRRRIVQAKHRKQADLHVNA